MARTKKAADPMDGAQFWDKNKTPADYMTDPVTGKRPDMTSEPYGTVKVDLTKSLGNTQLPPRSIWKKGEYKSVSFHKTTNDDDFNTWVVSGEGSPGNYVSREYVLPDLIATAHTPKHPADWPKNAWGTQPVKTSGGKKVPVAKAPSLPTNIRFRCPGCGHWYREMDLAGHSKVCPKDGEADWAVACECCVSLDDTAKAKKGFPRKVVAPKDADAKPKEVAKDGGGTSAA